MKGPFVSINTLLAGAAVFGIIISGAAIYGFVAPEATGANGATSAAHVEAVAGAATSGVTSIAKTNIGAATTTLATTTQTAALKKQLIVSITPSAAGSIIEGDPVMITIVGGTIPLSDIKSATLVAQGPNMAGRSATTQLSFLTYKNIPTAFYGTGINQKTGKVTVTVTMTNGTKLTAAFNIGARVSPTESLPVPAQLGGNSTSSQEQLVSDLDKENAELAEVYSDPAQAFWVAPFAWPLASQHAADVSGGIVVTDPFGYERDSGAENIIHKGTDFKAPPGTPVYAINAGYVRLSQLFTVYGNTVIVDHGMGIQSFYMHLSKMAVTPGEAVKQGQLLGYSGETGYSEGPHLHLTIRVGGISIDPIKFYALFGLTPDSTAD